MPGKRILSYCSKSSRRVLLLVVPLPGAESYCKCSNAAFIKAGEKMQRDTNPTEASGNSTGLTAEGRSEDTIARLPSGLTWF